MNGALGNVRPPVERRPRDIWQGRPSVAKAPVAEGLGKTGCAYSAIYESYIKFCGMIGQTPLTIEDWMVAREDTGTKKNKTEEFLKEGKSSAHQLAVDTY